MDENFDYDFFIARYHRHVLSAKFKHFGKKFDNLICWICGSETGSVGDFMKHFDRVHPDVKRKYANTNYQRMKHKRRKLRQAIKQKKSLMTLVFLETLKAMINYEMSVIEKELELPSPSTVDQQNDLFDTLNEKIEKKRKWFEN